MKNTPEEKKMLKTFMRYPELGKLIDCRENGFGFVDGHFVHAASGPWECPSMLELEGEWIAYVRGGDPRSFLFGREDWSTAVVSWMPVCQIEGFRNENSEELVMEQHEKFYLGMNGSYTRRLLKAPWYKSLWRRSAKCLPKSSLLPAEILCEAIRKSLLRQPSIERIAQILCDVSVSYWFTVDGQCVDPFSALDFKSTQFSQEALGSNILTEYITGPEEECWVSYLEQTIETFRLESCVE